MSSTDSTRVLSEVAAERGRQNAKWGEQNHPDGTGPEEVWTFTGPAEWVAHMAKLDTDAAAGSGTSTWRHILLEEVAEAFAELDPQALRAELVQVAAVATQWIEAIDRRVPDCDRKGCGKSLRGPGDVVRTQNGSVYHRACWEAELDEAVLLDGATPAP